MNFLETPVRDAYVVEPERISDERGHFARAWCAREFQERGLTHQFVGINEQWNPRRGTLRGLHLQCPPHSEAKFVRCSRGACFDVVVDARPDSPSYLRWFGVELTPENGRGLYLPEGCFHGYLTLEHGTHVHYLVSSFYEPGSERGARWNDPAFGIDWPIEHDLLISRKDRQWEDFTT